MPITLTCETETVLRRTAQRTGQGLDRAAGIAAVHEAMEDVKAGRERPYEEYKAERRLSIPSRHDSLLRP